MKKLFILLFLLSVFLRVAAQNEQPKVLLFKFRMLLNLLVYKVFS